MTPSERRVTLRAIGIVLRDSYRTEQIHVLEETLCQGAFARALAEQFRGEEAEAVLRDRPELRRDRVDYDWLRTLPAGTLGREYVRHLDENGIGPDLQAEPTRYVADETLSYLVRRFRQTHDLCHPLVELGTTPHEEIVIHAFHWGQVRLPVSMMIVVGGACKHLVPERRFGVLRRGLRGAFRSGRRALPLLPVYWERHWEVPLQILRERYRIAPIPRPHIRS